MQYNNCNVPSQNYVEQLVDDAVADRFTDVTLVLDGLPSEVNLSVLASIFQVPVTEVGYLKTGLNLSPLSVLYDQTTRTSWYRGIAVGTVISWVITDTGLIVTTSLGIYQLTKAVVITSSGSDLNLDYGSL